MTKYRYLGKEAIHVVGIGVVYPNQVIEAESINHPLFVDVKILIKEKKQLKKV